MEYREPKVPKLTITLEYQVKRKELTPAQRQPQNTEWYRGIHSKTSLIKILVHNIVGIYAWNNALIRNHYFHKGMFL